MREVRHTSVTAGEGDFAVTIEAAMTKEGLSCFVYGGTLPHVGGVALAAPGPELHGRRLSSADLWQLTVPGHKDAEAAALVARRLCKALGQPVAVTCGIHIDDATPAELQEIVRNCERAADALIERAS